MRFTFFTTFAAYIRCISEFRRDAVAKTRNLVVVQTEKHLLLALMAKVVAALRHGLAAVQMEKWRLRAKSLKVCFIRV